MVDLTLAVVCGLASLTRPSPAALQECLPSSFTCLPIILALVLMRRSQFCLLRGMVLVFCHLISPNKGHLVVKKLWSFLKRCLRRGAFRELYLNSTGLGAERIEFLRTVLVDGATAWP